jgi:hypothetical protein
MSLRPENSPQGPQSKFSPLKERLKSRPYKTRCENIVYYILIFRSLGGTYQAVWCSGKAIYLYLGSIRIESWQRYRLYWLILLLGIFNSLSRQMPAYSLPGPVLGIQVLSGFWSVFTVLNTSRKPARASTKYQCLVTAHQKPDASQYIPRRIFWTRNYFWIN